LHGTRRKIGVAQNPLRILLVGERAEYFLLVRELLERDHSALTTEPEQARSLEEARVLLQQKPYRLVLFEHETGDAESVQLVAEFLHAGGINSIFSSPKMRTTNSYQHHCVRYRELCCQIAARSSHAGSNDSHHCSRPLAPARAAKRARVAAEVVARASAVSR